MRIKFRIFILVIMVIMIGCSYSSSGADSPVSPPDLTSSNLPDPISSPELQDESIHSENWMATHPIRNERGYWEVEDLQGHIMVMIPSGTFTMGFTDHQIVDILCPKWEDTCTQEEIELWQRSHAHTVTLTKSFWLDKYEASVADYQSCVDMGVCEPTAMTRYNFGNLPYDTSDPSLQAYPILVGDYEHANTFCTVWREARFPSEAEWEFAARGYDQRTWPWGDLFPTHDLATFVEQWNSETPAPGIVPVDALPSGQSPFGVFNMAGNVVEWTSTWWYAPYPNEAVSDPLGPSTGESLVVRGGGYTNIEKDMTVSSRGAASTESVMDNVGVRCARSASP